MKYHHIPIVIGGAIALMTLIPLASQAEGRQHKKHCREYTQKVTIGNKIKTAYGTACLKPDGSWQLHPNKVEKIVHHKHKAHVKKEHVKVVHHTKKKHKHHAKEVHYKPHHKKRHRVSKRYYRSSFNSPHFKRHKFNRHHSRHGFNHKRYHSRGYSVHKRVHFGF